METTELIASRIKETPGISLLKKSRVFDHCSDEELEIVARVCETEVFRAGETIFEADVRAEHMYVVSEGLVRLSFTVTNYEAPQEITVDRKFEGDVLGWSAAVAPHTYTLTAVAGSDCWLLKISSDDIERLSAENAHFGHMLMKNLADIVGQRFNVMRRILADVVGDRLR